VALDQQGRPSFSLLQQRMHVRTPTAGLLTRVPVQLYVFDVLHLGGSSTLELAYTRRRWMLDDLGLDDDVTKTPPFWTNDAGKDLMRSAGELGMEGVVAKRLESRYQPGARSRWWIKTPLNKTVEVVIAGWKPAAADGRASSARCEQHHAPRSRMAMGLEVELVRQADLVDVTAGIVNFGLDRRWLRALFRDVPRDGFWRLVGGAVLSELRHRPASLTGVFFSPRRTRP